MIRYATENDLPFLEQNDSHIARKELTASLRARRVLLASDGDQPDGSPVGYLRYNLFWDNTPFANLLWICEPFRGKGYGRALMSFWEAEMRRAGYRLVLTSTQSDEQAQFFYRKLGYRDCGSLILPGEPLEIIFRKSLSDQ